MLRPRTVTVWCPDWAVIAAGLDPAAPAAVFHAHRVVARTPAATALGVAHGQRRRIAQRTCPELAIIDHDPARDARRFEPIVRAVAEIAPRLDVVEPGWVQLAARGPSRYFGGDAAVAARLETIVTEIEPGLAQARQVAVDLGVIRRHGAGVGVGIADGQAIAALAAQLAARTEAAVKVIEPGSAAEFLSPLPIGWLALIGGVEIELIELFARLGLRTCGDLASVAVGDVIARFGDAGYRAHQIASATDQRPLAATDPPPDRGVEHRFDTPVEQLDTVVFVGKRLADELTATLGAEGRVCVRLDVTIDSENGERSQRLWYRDQGMTSAAMVERIRWQLEGWATQRDAITGGIVAVRLVPDELRADDGYQGGIWGGRSQADVDATRAITRLAGVVGDAAVTVPEWVGGRLPGERFRWVQASGVDLDQPGDRLDRGNGPWPGSITPAPAVVCAEPAKVVDQSGALVRVSGRGEISNPPSAIRVGAEIQRIIGWAGPWPVEQRWWDQQRSRRLARLQLVTESGEALLVGVEHGEWVLLARYR